MIGYRLVVLMMVSMFLPGCAMFGSFKPMPQRLDEETQKRVEYGWDHLVALGPEVEHTALLDAVLLAQAWHAGVDHLYLRSEKQVGDMLVVMESRFDRTRPDADVFTVSFLDARGRMLREEHFTPAEMDDAIALYRTPDGDLENETPAEHDERMARLAERDARLQRVQEVFPAPPEPPDEPPSDDPDQPSQD